MRTSSLFAPTLREVPAEAEIASHQLMLRAGMLRKVASGIYTYMPLAWRSMNKIIEIIREEMDAAGGQELAMPAVQPAEWWQQSGRWDVYGAEMWRIQDRHGRDFCLGPTHEEVITTLVRNDVRSYKQLPLRLYQIQAKYRDERRPRFGLMRSREFLMKDLYSFDKDEAGLEESYALMYQAYSNIFSRCGLDFRAVEADSGAIGGTGSHEFMALAASGESAIVYCDKCNYAASVEIASHPPVGSGLGETPGKQKTVSTPNCRSIEEVAVFLNMPTDRILKTLCYVADGKLVLVLLRGDRQLSEVKLKNILDCLELNMAGEETVAAAGLAAGYIGPVGIEKIKILADAEVPLMVNAVAGANQEGKHILNVNYADYKVDKVADLREVEPGETCPHCGGILQGARGIEVGQVFKLREKYSEKLGACYTNENSEEKNMIMGCYGIGVGRTLAAIIEQSHDEYGIIWPFAVAPYQVIVVPVNDKDEELMQVAEDMYATLLKNKVEVVLEDRKERPGVKFNDADLVGYPLRITLSSKKLAAGMVEIKTRCDNKVIELPITEAIGWVLVKLKEEGCLK